MKKKYIYISKLDDKKVLKLAYDDHKDNIIFRDYSNVLRQIDQEKYAKFLDIIGTEQARLAALWLRMIKKYPKDGLLCPCLSNPIMQELIPKAKAYARKNNIVIKYEDIPIASFTYDKDMFNAIELKEMPFHDALKMIIKKKEEEMKKEEDLKNNNIMYYQFAHKAYPDVDYDVLFNFSGVYELSEIKFREEKQTHSIKADTIIKELDEEKMGDFIYSIEENEKIKIYANAYMIELFDNVLTKLDLSKVKNKYLRKLIRLRQKYDIYTSLLFINNKFPEEFGVVIPWNSDKKMPRHALKIARKFMIKNEIKSLKKDMNELKINGFLIKSDDSVEIIDYTQAANYFDMSFVI